MSGDFQFLDIILFALVAAFLILRLRSVLGRRNGHQTPSSDPFKTTKPRKTTEDKVVRLPERAERPADSQEVADRARPRDTTTELEAGLVQIEVADPRFDSNEFLSGARIAFEMILTAFAAGETNALKPFLSQEVFGNFCQSIRDRDQAGETMEITLVGIRTAEIVEAYMTGRTAHVTVKFVSEQIAVTRNDNGEVVEGNPNSSTEVTDFWTFARDTRDRDPNWTLVATGTPE